MARNPEVTHKIMSSIKSRDTQPEIILRKALWHKNMRYRINNKMLPGKPDIIFTKYKIAVFCDGDFWHGHNWVLRGIPSLEEELKGYSEFWRNKILRNIEHDMEINKSLNTLGWTVVRLWESDIKKNIDECVQNIQEAICETKILQYEMRITEPMPNSDENE